MSHFVYHGWVCDLFVSPTQYLKSPAEKYKSFTTVFFLLFFVCVFLYPSPIKKRRPRNLQESAVFLSPENPFFLVLWRVHRLSCSFFFYWIPLKRHIANTMAKSCGKNKWGIGGEWRRKIPIIIKQVLSSFMFRANWTSSKVTWMTLCWCKLHF